MLNSTFHFSLIVLLMVIAFLSGIGITTIGPGGIFVTVALYSLTPFSSGEIAGTAHATFIATGIVGSAAYIYSGVLKSKESRAIAVNLSVTSVVGVLFGTYANTYVPRPVFGLLLGGVAMAVGGIILYRGWRGFYPLYTVETTTRTGQTVLGILGLVLGICSGLLGIGGPVLAVPALILIGVPLLMAVAVAQIQSIFIATFATIGYLFQDNVSLPLVALIGFPLLAGVVVGWKAAHLVNTAKLKVALGIVLITIGPYIAL